ncbi:MAG: nuclear transport factor 2 family protein [Minicystis sp.]
MPSDASEVLAQNQAFYDAFSSGDADAVDALWSKLSPIACIHPGWEPLHGRDEVMASFRAILRSPHPPNIRCQRPAATVLGEVAFVICAEALDDSALVATNVFVREDGDWKLVHHQAGPVSAARPEARARARTPGSSGMLN